MADRRLAIRITGRINNKSGFTMGEVLVATIIMLLVSAIVAAGIPAAARAYKKSLRIANSEVLMSTALSTLRNELSTAKDIEIDDGGQYVQYYNEAFGSISRISKAADTEDGTDGNIMYSRFYTSSGEGALIGAYQPPDSDETSLVSDETAGGDLYVTYGSIEKKTGDSKVIIFNNIEVKEKGGGSTGTKVEKYSIRALAN